MRIEYELDATVVHRIFEAEAGQHGLRLTQTLLSSKVALLEDPSAGP